MEKLVIRKNKTVKIILYWLSLFIIFEIILRLFFSIFDFPPYIVNSTLQRIGWINRHLKQKTNYRLSEAYLFDVYDQNIGWKLKPNIHNMNVFDGKIINSNSKGIRGKSEYDYEKKENKIRILVIGDSFTFGEEVSDNETYPYYLQQLIPRAEVINLGVHGYGHDQMLSYLKEEGIKYKPDIVILGYLYGDNFRNILDFYYYAKPKFILENNELKLGNVPVPAPEFLLRNEFYRLKTLDLFNILNLEIMRKIGTTQKNMEKLTIAILDEIYKTITSINAVPVFIYLPSESEITDSNKQPSSKEKFLLEFCEKRNIPCLLLRHYFMKKIKEGIQFKSIVHWKPQEHFVAAEGIKEYLSNKKLLDR